MKKFDRVITLVLALLMVLSLSLTVFADEGTTPTGKITITNASAGQTYTAYKVFDATYNETTQKTAYTVKAGALYDAVKAETDLFIVADTADAYGNYVVSMVEGKDQEVLAWLEDNVSLFTSAGTVTPESGNTVEFDVAYGYYYITSTLGATVTVNTNTPSVNLIDKNTANPGPNPNKQYKYIVSGGSELTEISASVGETVSFQVSFIATNHITSTDAATGNVDTKQVEKYIVTDQPSGLKIDNSTIKVSIKFGDEEATELASTAYSVSGNVVTIPWATSTTEENVTTWTSLYKSPVTVTITYDAEVIALTNVTNDVDIDYKTTDSTSTTNVNPPTPEPPTKVDTYTLTVKKSDTAEGTTILEGAEFKLYKKTGGTEENPTMALINLVKVTEKVDNVETTYYRPATSEDATTVDYLVAGEMEVRGLGNGTYYLEEVKAPAGYNKLTAKADVAINGADATEVVVNQAGTVLPSTGGMGTTMFYTIGGLMVLVAVILLVTKRRMRDVT